MARSRAAHRPRRVPGAARGPREAPGPCRPSALPSIGRPRAWRSVLLLCAAIGAVSGSYAGHLEAAPPKLVTRGAAPSAPLPAQQVVRRTLRSDASQEYLLYVPSTGGRGAPVFVAVHGISRNVEEHARLFAPYAETFGVVLVAPRFTREGNAGYQRLGLEGLGRRADLALDAILADVEASTGADVEKLYLFGFSGGAQFVHRYTLAHPDRVARAVVGAAGWYTFPDSVTPYPYGLGPSTELPGLRFQPDEFLRVPIAVFVGVEDTAGESLRRNPDVDRQQGATRRERALNWVAAMRRAADARGLEPRVTCELVPGIGHSFRQFMQEGGLGDKVFAALFGSPRYAPPRPREPVPGELRSGSR